MNVFKGFIIATFSFLGALFLLVGLIRLSNGSDAFVSLSSIQSYFSNLDLFSSFKKAISEFLSIIDSFKDSFDLFGHVKDLFSFFDALGKFFNSFSQMVVFPIKIIYYVGYFIYDIIMAIVNFFQVVCGVDSWWDLINHVGE